MSAPEKKVTTKEGKTVLSQDLAQYEQSARIGRVKKYRKEKRQYDKDQAQYEKDLAKYEKELAQYEKEKALFEKQQNEIKQQQAEKQRQNEIKQQLAEKQRQKEIAEQQRREAEKQKLIDLGLAKLSKPEPFTGGKYNRGFKTKGYAEHLKQVKAFESQKKEIIGRIEAQHAQKYGNLEIRNVSLGRSAASAINDPHIGRPGDGHAAYQYDVARLNQRVLSGSIKPSQYKQELKKIDAAYIKFQRDQSKQFARTAQTNLKSTLVKQSTARALASQTGAAIGTITDGSASISNQSRTANKIPIAKITPRSPPISPNVPVSILQREERVKVTTPDGKERIFKNRETADKFVKRVEGSYISKVSRPTFQEQNNPYDISSSLRKSGIKNANVVVKDNLIGVTNFGKTALYSAPSTYITQKGTEIGPPKQQKNPIGNFITGLDTHLKNTDNQIIKFFGGFTQGAASLFATGVNLEQQGGRFLTEKITGDRIGQTKQIETSKTVDAEITGGLITGIGKAYKTGDIVQIGSETRKGLESSYSLAKTQGIVQSAGQIGFLLLPVPKLKGLSPIKTEAFKISTESGKVKTVARTLDVGLGSKTKPVITKIEKNLNIGGPLKNLEKSSLKEAESFDRGLELSTQGKLGTKIITSQKGMDILLKEGKLLPRDVRAIQLSQEMAGLIKTSAKKVPDSTRQKAKVLPEKPLTSVLAGAESKALNDVIMPRLPPKKGTLSETLQLDKDLVKPKIETTKPIKPKDIRSDSTGDLDVDFGHMTLGTYRAKKAGKMAIREFSKVAEPNRRFYQKGTNVFGETKGKESEEILNILTKRDEKTGYLNKSDLRPFGISLKKRIINVKTSKESRKTASFVSLEQNALNRIESIVSLQGPKAQKFKGETKDIPYLSKEFAEKGPLKTPKGYTVLPSEHRLKDISKLLSQDTEQIARNLKSAGLEQESKRLGEITKEYKSLYPEIDFKSFDYPNEMSFASYPSKLESIGSSLSRNKQLVNPLIISARPKPENKQESKQSITSKSSVSEPSSYSVIQKAQYATIPKISYSKPSYSKPSYAKLTWPSYSSAYSRTSSSKTSASKGSTSKPSTGKPSTSSTALSFPSIGKLSYSFPSPPKSPSAFRGSRPSRVIPTIKHSSVLLPTRRPGITPAPLINFGNKSKKEKSEFEQFGIFLGNVPETRIEGVFRRKEITTSPKKIKKYSALDMRQAKKEYDIKFKNFFSGSKKSKVKLF